MFKGGQRTNREKESALFVCASQAASSRTKEWSTDAQTPARAFLCCTGVDEHALLWSYAAVMAPEAMRR